ncbi:MAG: hypothetical protein KatS3mg085_699 [Candidatus Dojkabacteria bacterium]|nr:MAG: hypothetical protein KatS3mg085_699 [Candidatus Dojkabacteria bacterium]
MKNKTFLVSLITILLGVGVLGVLFVAYRDERVENSDLVQIAEKLNLDVDRFLEDYESDEVKNIVEQNKNEALEILKEAGINGAQTPTVAINGVYVQRVTGKTLTDLINERLENADELPIVVDIYEDYKCSACAQFQFEVFEAYMNFTSEYVVINKKHLPFLRPQSTNYAYGAEAARKQSEEAFEKFNIELFILNHPSISYDFYPFTEDALAKILD